MNAAVAITYWFRLQLCWTSRGVSTPSCFHDAVKRLNSQECTGEAVAYRS